MHWLEDGDHGFKPRKKSGFTEAAHWQSAIAAIIQFLGRVYP
jgi:predicted alpha/beta-hydrolase family hydrolase